MKICQYLRFVMALSVFSIEQSSINHTCIYLNVCNPLCYYEYIYVCTCSVSPSICVVHVIWFFNINFKINEFGSIRVPSFEGNTGTHNMYILFFTYLSYTVIDSQYVVILMDNFMTY